MEFLLGLIPVFKLRLGHHVSLCLKIKCSFPPLWECSIMLIFVPKMDCLFSWRNLGSFISPSVLFLPTCTPTRSYLLQCYLIETIFFSGWNCLCAAEAMERLFQPCFKAAVELCGLCTTLWPQRFFLKGLKCMQVDLFRLVQCHYRAMDPEIK